jgi:hypothetical protein
VLLTPYPPGIPLLIPGERFNKTIVRYLQFAREFNATFPGFETDVHGLVKGRTAATTWIACAEPGAIRRRSAAALGREGKPRPALAGRGVLCPASGRIDVRKPGVASGERSTR